MGEIRAAGPGISSQGNLATGSGPSRPTRQTQITDSLESLFSDIRRLEDFKDQLFGCNEEVAEKRSEQPRDIPALAIFLEQLPDILHEASKRIAEAVSMIHGALY